VAVEDHAACSQVVKPGDAAGQGGLAATRLADEPERLAAAHVEADLIDRVYLSDAAPQQGARNYREMFDDSVQADEQIRVRGRTG
jgi:hypothetical protein